MSRPIRILHAALVEGAGMLCLVGYLLSDSTMPAMIALMAVVALVLLRPSRIEGHG